jgi:protein tyrosine phosphatase (PTP) superfamily phosphohydrolase (DUF442 family)
MTLSALLNSCFTPPMRLLTCLLTACLVASCAEEPKPITPSSPQGTVTLEDIEVPNQSTAMEGVLTAGQLSEEQMVALAGLGYQSFVSLREADEGGSGWEEGFAAEKGLHFVRLPIAGADGIDEAHARQLDTLMEAEARPMVLYCGSSNRVGALLALRAFHVQDMGAAESLELGKSTGVTGLESMLEEKLGL